jgi:hypothetical protein
MLSSRYRLTPYRRRLSFAGADGRRPVMSTVAGATWLPGAIEGLTG